MKYFVCFFIFLAALLGDSRLSESKPKLLIIMDDIHTILQVQKLKALQLEITPSIFPKSAYNPNASKIAHIAQSYMVHLPLEALSFYQKELEPIKMGVSKAQLRAIFNNLTRDFPHLKYINNHTGSKFTASLEDMQNLLDVMDEFGLKFIDSVTTAQAASPKISRAQNRLIMQRDVFLDNEVDEKKILKQLDIAVQKAKSKGYAIAICHPNEATFRALKAAKKMLDSEIQLVSPQGMQRFLDSQNIAIYERETQYAQK